MKRGTIHSYHTKSIGIAVAEMTQFNYMLEVDWFLRQMPVNTAKAKTTFVVHRSPPLVAEANSKARTPSFAFVFPVTEQFGTHHSKMMWILYEDRRAHLIIHTANLIERDWGKKSQFVWVSSLLQPKTPSGETTGPNRAFERDLLLYLDAYGKDLADLRDCIKRYDFSHEVGMIVASAPGRHKSNGAGGNTINRWGYRRLAALLKQDLTLSHDLEKDSTLVFQYSSVGSLGKDDGWLMSEFATALNSSSQTKLSPLMRPKKVALVFPTVAQVRDSLQGWPAGNSIPFSNDNWTKQKSYMRPLLKSWIAVDAERERAMPHVKTFSRVNEATKELAWLLVTSHNLSKAAWGSLELKGTQLFIRSYEIGVLIMPAYFKATKSQSVMMKAVTAEELRGLQPSLVSAQDAKREDADQEEVIVPVRLPFDLPLTSYTAFEEPWRWDVAFQGVDSHGNTRDI
ncbi:tyrosyl-DNA phosphodiesterase I [Chytriomyces sp. MP71]|nr:tyrosyl-DNA phosphodiesterase I [Chytriomyces sp. MP71]